MKNCKKVLLVSYNFPPMREAQSVRWAFLSKWLSHEGWNVDVLTITLPEYYGYLINQVPKEIGVYRTFPGPLQNIFFRLKAKAGVEDQGFKEKRTKPTIKIARVGYRTLRSLANKVLIPDLRTEWLPFALRAGTKLIEKNKYDLIFSSHEPGVSHLVANKLKKLSNTPWIVDFGDPWVAQATPAWRKGLDHIIEKSFIDNIDGFLFTNDNTINMYQKLYPQIEMKPIIKITQGFDPEVTKSTIASELPDDSMNIVYTGTFYKGLREPYETFRAIKMLWDQSKRVRLFLAGNVFDEYINYIHQHSMTECIKYLGYLNYEDTIALQKAADVLLYIGNANSYQTPGKIFEYMGIEKPILAIKNDPSDYVIDLIKKNNRGFGAQNESIKIKHQLSLFYEMWMKELLHTEFKLAPVELYSFRNHARVIIDKFSLN